MNKKPESIVDAATPVLIVDDNTQYSQILKRMLQHGLGYQEVTTVSTTENAYKLIQQAPDKFKLLFVDYNFAEGTTGGELLQKLNQEALLTDKVAFLITAEPSAENLKQALGNGASGVVAKPFDRQELKKQIDKAQRSLDSDEGESF